MTHVFDLVKDKQDKKNNYFNLGAFIIFVMLYLTTLYLQLNTYNTFLVNSSFNALLPQVVSHSSIFSREMLNLSKLVA